MAQNPQTGQVEASLMDAVDFERYALAWLRAQALAEERVFLVGNELPREYAFADVYAPAADGHQVCV